MFDVISFFEKKLKEYGVVNYDTAPVLIEVSANSSMEVGSNDDFFMLVNFFTQTGSASGNITSEVNAVELTPATLNTSIYKHQVFKGKVKIKNTANETLYVEFLKNTQVECK